LGRVTASFLFGGVNAAIRFQNEHVQLLQTHVVGMQDAVDLVKPNSVPLHHLFEQFAIAPQEYFLAFQNILQAHVARGSEADEQIQAKQCERHYQAADERFITAGHRAAYRFAQQHHNQKIEWSELPDGSFTGHSHRHKQHQIDCSTPHNEFPPGKIQLEHGVLREVLNLQPTSAGCTKVTALPVPSSPCSVPVRRASISRVHASEMGSFD